MGKLLMEENLYTFLLSNLVEICNSVNKIMFSLCAVVHLYRPVVTGTSHWTCRTETWECKHWGFC